MNISRKIVHQVGFIYKFKFKFASHLFVFIIVTEYQINAFNYEKCKKNTFSSFFYSYVTCYDLKIVISGTLGLIITNSTFSG